VACSGTAFRPTIVPQFQFINLTNNTCVLYRNAKDSSIKLAYSLVHPPGRDGG
jgi:hypothetical protein